MLAPHEAPAVMCERHVSDAPFVITCDHAGRLIPEALGDLGLDEAERRRHIAWDIGALGVASELAALLDAPLVAQRYSRLVVDCNRPPGHPNLVPLNSEATEIPGNAGLTEAERAARVQTIYAPYHATLEDLLTRRGARGLPSVFVAVHSFTPVFHGQSRPWHVGVLYGSDARLARPLLEHFRGAGDLCVGDNEPYRIDDKDHGIPHHAIGRGLVNVLLEVRQDLIENTDGQRVWARRLREALLGCLTHVRP